MSEQGQRHFEVPKEMRSMADAGLEQARKTFEKFIEGAQVAADSLSAGTATVGAGAGQSPYRASTASRNAAIMTSATIAASIPMDVASRLPAGRRDGRAGRRRGHRRNGEPVLGSVWVGGRVRLRIGHDTIVARRA